MLLALAGGRGVPWARRRGVGAGAMVRHGLAVLGIVLGSLLPLGATAWAECLAGGRTEVPLSGRSGLVVTFVHAEVSHLVVTLPTGPQTILWSGHPFTGLTLGNPGGGVDGLVLRVAPVRIGCLLRVERY